MTPFSTPMPLTVAAAPAAYRRGVRQQCQLLSVPTYLMERGQETSGWQTIT